MPKAKWSRRPCFQNIWRDGTSDLAFFQFSDGTIYEYTPVGSAAAACDCTYFDPHGTYFDNNVRIPHGFSGYTKIGSVPGSATQIYAYPPYDQALAASCQIIIPDWTPYNDGTPQDVITHYPGFIQYDTNRHSLQDFLAFCDVRNLTGGALSVTMHITWGCRGTVNPSTNVFAMFAGSTNIYRSTAGASSGSTTLTPSIPALTTVHFNFDNSNGPGNSTFGTVEVTYP